MIEDIFRTVMNMAPSQRRIQLDIDALHNETEQWRQGLFPWVATNEIELLSLNHESKWFKQSLGRALKGVYYSIYDEPMIVFGYKNYLRQGVNALVWAETKKHEFIYRRRKGRTDFFIDREHVGFITREGLMYGGSRNRLLARRNQYTAEHYSVVVWDKEVAHIIKPENASSVNPRAFEVLEKMGPKEELLLISLGFLTILEDTFKFDELEKK